MTLTCECGAEGHVDDTRAFYVKCYACGSVYEMPINFAVSRATAERLAERKAEEWELIRTTEPV